MKYKINCTIFLLCISAAAFAQVGNQDKTLQQIITEQEAYFESQRIIFGEDFLNMEGSEYNVYRKWLSFWEPRLGLNHSFREYMTLLSNANPGNPLRGASSTLTKSFGNLDAWKEIGPTEKPAFGLPTVGGGALGIGPIQNIIFYRPNPNIMLAASMAGGLFYTSNKGVNWTNAGSDFWNGSGCNSAAFSPVDPNTWYGCSNMGGQNNASTIPSYGLSMGPFGGVYRTTNAGLSYDLIADNTDFYVEGALTTLLKILIDPANPAVAYVATSSGLYKSSNANSLNLSSINWTLIQQGYIEDIEFKTNNSSVIFISVKTTSNTWDIKYTSNSGGLWTSIPSQPSIANIKNIAIETSEADNGKIWVLYLNTGSVGRLYTCDYPGFSWTAKGGNISNIWYGRGHAFCVSNFNAATIYTAQEMRLYKSTDGGITWSAISSTSPATAYHVDLEDIITPPVTCSTCNQNVWIATHGGAWFSPDNCSTVQSRNSGLGVAEILGFSNSVEDPEVIGLGLDHDGTVLSGGTYSNSWIPSWETVFNYDGMPPLIDYSGTKYVWAAGQISPYQLSQNYGHASTYAATTFPSKNDWGNEIKQNSGFPNIVYVKGKNNVGSLKWENLYRSNNRGVPGTPTEQISDIKNANSIADEAYIWGMYTAPSDPNYFYMRVYSKTSNSLYLLRTTSLLASSPTAVQNSWVNLQLPPGGFNKLVVDESNPNIVYFARSAWTGSMILKADYTIITAPIFTDISDQSGTMPPTFVSNIVLEKGSNGGIYVSTDFGNVFYTNNDYLQNTARTWIKMDKSLPNIPITGLEINYKVSKLRLATPGRGVWEHDLFCPSDLFLHLAQPACPTNRPFYEAVNEITSDCNLFPANTFSVTYRAGTYIELTPGFTATPNSSNRFLAYIHPCSFP